MIPPFRSPLQVTECVQVPPLVFLDPTLVDVVNGDGVEVVQLFAPPAILATRLESWRANGSSTRQTAAA
jgi:hypothetical protein